MSPGGLTAAPRVLQFKDVCIFHGFFLKETLFGSVSHRQHVDECRDIDACPDQVSGFKEEVKWLIEQLLQELEDQFKVDVKV